jgi:hypothetical protein
VRHHGHGTMVRRGSNRVRAVLALRARCMGCAASFASPHGARMPAMPRRMDSRANARRVRQVRARRGPYLRIRHAVRLVAADGGIRARKVPEVRGVHSDASEANAAAAVGAAPLQSRGIKCSLHDYCPTRRTSTGPPRKTPRRRWQWHCMREQEQPRLTTNLEPRSIVAHFLPPSTCSIAVERAAKYARTQRRALRVYCRRRS